jgi:hypothetical protein
MSCDFVSLVLQAAGGAIADSYLTNLPMQAMGVHIMVAGLAFQVASLLLFAILCIEYAWRVKKRKPRLTEYIQISHPKRFHLFLYCESAPLTYSVMMIANFSIAIAFATTCIIARSSFRLAELEGGFSSSLANNQVLLMIFDGAMMVLTCMALTVFHAGLAFESNW